jgi:hypothetical protein
MAHIFKYVVLMAVPDRRRGERVNIGLMVFREHDVDVRLAGVAKIGAIAGGNWTAYADDVRHRLSAQFNSGSHAMETIVATPRLDEVIEASEVASLRINSVAEYETTINEILEALVVKPHAPARPKTTRINTEIAAQFKRDQMLAQPDDPIDSHKVVRDFLVEDNLKADFALQNGALHVTTTLDLRRPEVNIKEATLKAIILDRAGKIFPDVHRIGVYALAGEEAPFKTHLELLRGYSQDCFNWADASERRRFNAMIGTAYIGSGQLRSL